VHRSVCRCIASVYIAQSTAVCGSARSGDRVQLCTYMGDDLVYGEETWSVSRSPLTQFWAAPARQGGRLVRLPPLASLVLCYAADPSRLLGRFGASSRSRSGEAPRRHGRAHPRRLGRRPHARPRTPAAGAQARLTSSASSPAYAGYFLMLLTYICARFLPFAS
jgi:hypothetical protein